jgi:hypothetical protein
VVPLLVDYGTKMGNMILQDQIDSAALIKPAKARH